MDVGMPRHRSTVAPRIVRGARIWLAVYAVALALIAFWPTPVDRGASGLLGAISRAVPWLTYDVIETGANVALFVPFGALVALVVQRSAAVLGMALATTVAIEVGQALLLSQRTPSLRDVVANVCGAAVGLVLVRIIGAVQPRSASGRERPIGGQGRPMP